MAAATAGEVKAASVKWLSDGVYVLEVQPYPKWRPRRGGVDRKQMPAVGAPPDVRFPPFQRAALANGLKVILAERHSVPVVRLGLLLDAGRRPTSSPCPARPAGHGHARRGHGQPDVAEISDELAALGAELGSGSNLDTSSVACRRSRTSWMRPSTFTPMSSCTPLSPRRISGRLQKLQITDIQQEKDSPVGMALRVFPKIIYGPGHAYGNPFSGSGFEATVAKLTRADLVKFHETWFKPNHATLVVVGDTTMAEIKPKIEKLFQGWKPGKVPSKNVAAVALRQDGRVHPG